MRKRAMVSEKKTTLDRPDSVDTVSSGGSGGARADAFSEDYFNQSLDLLCIADTDGLFLRLNPEWERVLGYSVDELIGTPFLDYVHPDDLASTRAAMARLHDGGQVHNFVNRYRTSSGDYRWIEWRSASSGSTVYAAARDITERVAAETALRRSEQQFRAVFEQAGVGVVQADITSGAIAQANRRFCQIVGYLPEEIGRLSIGELTQPDDLLRERAFLSQLIAGDIGEFSHEKRYLHKDGHLVWVHITVSPMWAAGEQPRYCLGVVQDISARKEAEEALRQSEERFAKAFQANPGPTVISDIETGRIIDVNASWLTMLGHSREETIGHTSWEIGIWKDPNHRDQAIAALKRQGSFRDVKTVFRTKTGETRFVLWSAEVITLGGRQVMLSLLHDMTAQQRAEEERLRLEEHVRQAQKMEAIGTLAGGIAHDFNNLLTTIIGNVALIRHKHTLEPSVQERVRIIEEMVQRGADLTRQLLGFAKGGKYEVRPVDLNALLRESLDMFGRTHRQITVVTELAEGPLTVEIDRGQIHQVLLNIYINAAHAMPGGGRLEVISETVTVDSGGVLSEEMASGEYGRITITDSGHGMDQETMQRVFDPFFTTKPVGQGTGLGLASAYGIVKNHGGVIRVVSGPGAGSSFIMFLPICRVSVEGVESPESSAKVGESRQETILVVDDEEMILAVSRDLLTELGYRVLTAINGEQALQQFTEQDGAVDLVILDMILPDMDGSAIFDRLRQCAPRVKVLLASGYSADKRARAILDRGCNGFIQKPYNLDALARKVREILDSFI